MAPMSSEGAGRAPVYVAFSREVLEQLRGDWSKPVQLRMVRTGNEWEIEVRDPFASPDALRMTPEDEQIVRSLIGPAE